MVLLYELHTLNVGRESTKTKVAMISLVVHVGDESIALRATALQLASTLLAVEEPVVLETRELSDELATESDAHGSFGDSLRRWSASRYYDKHKGPSVRRDS
jgi:hypothetical protein